MWSNGRARSHPRGVKCILLSDATILVAGATAPPPYAFGHFPDQRGVRLSFLGEWKLDARRTHPDGARDRRLSQTLDRRAIIAEPPGLEGALASFGQSPPTGPPLPAGSVRIDGGGRV
uniref:Uncharacterized protein n=1 Tax=Plectus sambesii TaxID=2011161 RepID=A0A914UHS1_9BILA